jgi:hypothetical protein
LSIVPIGRKPPTAGQSAPHFPRLQWTSPGRIKVHRVPAIVGNGVWRQSCSAPRFPISSGPAEGENERSNPGRVLPQRYIGAGEGIRTPRPQPWQGCVPPLSFTWRGASHGAIGNCILKEAGEAPGECRSDQAATGERGFLACAHDSAGLAIRITAALRGSAREHSDRIAAPSRS